MFTFEMDSEIRGIPEPRIIDRDSDSDFKALFSVQSDSESESLHVTPSFKFWVCATEYLGIPECRRNEHLQLRAFRTTTEEMVCLFIFGPSLSESVWLSTESFFWCAVICFDLQSKGVHGFAVNETYPICCHARVCCTRKTRKLGKSFNLLEEAN